MGDLSIIRGGWLTSWRMAAICALILPLALACETAPDEPPSTPFTFSEALNMSHVPAASTRCSPRGAS